MLIYFDKIKKDLGYENQDQEVNKDIKLVYLTLDRHKPSLYEEFTKRNITPILIDYRKEIKQWLDDCIKSEFVDVVLKEILKQYLNVTNQLTNDVDRASKLINLISINLKFALKNKDEISKMGDFTHVKWHTVDAFWNELITELEQNSKAKILKRITTDEITKQTHKGSKRPYGIVFEINAKRFYVMNDAQNGLTIGFVTSSDIKQPKDQWDTIDGKIKFYDFNEVTFEKINKDKRKDLINETIEKINEFIGRK